MSRQPDSGIYPPFDRRFFESDEDFTVIGGGALGGKALGLASAKRVLQEAWPAGRLRDVRVEVPRLTVLTTDAFEQFMGQNALYEVALSDLPDERIAHAFLQAELPAAYAGDLRALAARVRTPLAVRSSSLLEDALQHPFAGVYATKLIANNQAATGERFRKLLEAIKFVWASTFFRDAKAYMRTIDLPPQDERMAVVIQEVIGEQFNERFYPIVSGVIRTHNYYPSGPGRPEDGVISLALGLGKTIVDGGVVWTYCPRFPGHRPPFASTRALLKNTQTRFWAVRMEAAPYDPVNEAEQLVQAGLDAAEWDDVLRFTASTYDPGSDRLTPGTGMPGPRVLTFSRILELADIPLNRVAQQLSEHCKAAMQCDVEIEFAASFDRFAGLPVRFGFLQVRPMLVARDVVSVAPGDQRSDRTLVASDNVLGNGEDRTLRDVVYVRPTAFEARHTRLIAAELEAINHAFVEAKCPYVLIGFGRWGSSDPWLGIPATWPQLSAARVIVEATLPQMDVDASQGSHFFHNMISFRVLYFTVPQAGAGVIDWEWLERQPAAAETGFLRHVRLEAPLEVRVDGRHGRGVILHA